MLCAVFAHQILLLAILATRLALLLRVFEIAWTSGGDLAESGCWWGCLVPSVGLWLPRRAETSCVIPSGRLRAAHDSLCWFPSEQFCRIDTCDQTLASHYESPRWPNYLFSVISFLGKIMNWRCYFVCVGLFIIISTSELKDFFKIISNYYKYTFFSMFCFFFLSWWSGESNPEHPFALHCLTNFPEETKTIFSSLVSHFRSFSSS